MLKWLGPPAMGVIFVLLFNFHVKIEGISRLFSWLLSSAAMFDLHNNVFHLYLLIFGCVNERKLVFLTLSFFKGEMFSMLEPCETSNEKVINDLILLVSFFFASNIAC